VKRRGKEAAMLPLRRNDPTAGKPTAGRLPAKPSRE